MTLKELLEEIEACVPEGGDWCTPEKATFLAALVVALRPKVVVELGVWMGGSAVPIAIALRSLGAGQLVAVDAWSPDASVMGQSGADRAWWGETQGTDGHARAYETFVARLAKHGVPPDRCIVRRQRTDEATVPLVIDILHHDANHGPQAVLDVDRWTPAVRLGGILILDDLQWQGGHVSQARDRARELGFVDLYELGTGVVMQRVRSAPSRTFTPGFSPSARYLLRDQEEETYFARHGGAPEATLIAWASQFTSPELGFVDVGAHVGTWTQHLAPSSAAVHAFEPQRSTYDRLCEGVRQAGLENVTCHDAALGARGPVDLSVVSVDGGGSTLRHRPELGTVIATERVRGAQLDDFQDDLGKVGLVKIDAEGSELAVLRGAGRVIAAHHPRLLLEAWTHEWYRDDRAALIAHVTDLGYTVKAVEGWPEMLLAEHPLSPPLRRV